MPFGTDQLCVWHIPKTGGTWLREAMIRGGLDVKTIDKPHGVYSDRDPYAVTSTRDHMKRFNAIIMRDPVDWYSSCWRWMRKTDVGAIDELWWKMFPELRPSDLQDFTRFIIRNVGSYSRAVKKYCPCVDNYEWRSCVRLHNDHLEDNACTWLRATGVEFNEEELRKTPRLNVTKEAAPEVPEDLAQLIRQSERIGA